MAFLLAQALVADPLACACFWFLGLVLGSMMRWFRLPIKQPQEAITHELSERNLQRPSAATYGIGPPSASVISSATSVAEDQQFEGADDARAPSPPPTPPLVHVNSASKHAIEKHVPDLMAQHASLPAPRHPWYVHERDAREVLTSVAIQDRGEEKGWKAMMERQVANKYTYTAHRRSLPSGLAQYRTVTTFCDTTPIELMEFLLDDSARKEWEEFLVNVDILHTGDWLGAREQIVRNVRKFPFKFLSEREYVIARKAWVVQEADGGEPQLLPLTAIKPGVTLIAVTKGLDVHPTAPPTHGLIRTKAVNSSWVCRAVPDPFGGPTPAAQVVLLHNEDVLIAEYLARTAIGMGMSKFVKDLTSGQAKFKLARRAAGVPPHSLDLTAYGHAHTNSAVTVTDTPLANVRSRSGRRSRRGRTDSGTESAANKAAGAAAHPLITTGEDEEEHTWLVGTGDQKDMTSTIQSIEDVTGDAVQDQQLAGTGLPGSTPISTVSSDAAGVGGARVSPAVSRGEEELGAPDVTASVHVTGTPTHWGDGARVDVNVVDKPASGFVHSVSSAVGKRSLVSTCLAVVAAVGMVGLGGKAIRSGGNCRERRRAAKKVVLVDTDDEQATARLVFHINEAQ